ncbi:hypothetical protein JL721_12840 [Aureococcus anophagefferens]|nr:hypothetical protein JL721_12840 [Aureococcus anophagefferens]
MAPRLASLAALLGACLLLAAGARPSRRAASRRGRDDPRGGASARALAVRGGDTEDIEYDEDDEPGAVASLLASLPPTLRVHRRLRRRRDGRRLDGRARSERAFSLDTYGTVARLQLWRPLTSACFLGEPSMGSATSLYLLVKYGKELEAAGKRTARGSSCCRRRLGFAGGATGVPFTANALITAVIYACSRLEPFGNVQFQFGITLKYWMLPFGLMVVEMLQQQSVAAVFPHVLGILCAHFHHFFAVVWPRLTADAESAAPKAKTAKVGRKLGSG